MSATKRPQSAAPTSPNKRNHKTLPKETSLQETLRPNAGIERASGQSYLAGAGVWGHNQKTREKIRPATATHRIRKVIKVRNTEHLRSSKPAFKSSGPAPLHIARDSFIYPSSRPSSSHSTLSSSRPGSAVSSAAPYKYGGFRKARNRNASGDLVRPLSSMSRASAISIGSTTSSHLETDQRMRYPPWSRPASRDAFSKHPSTSQNSSRSSSRSNRSRPTSSNPGYTPRSRPSSSASSRPTSSRPTSSNQPFSRPGTGMKKKSNNNNNRPYSSMTALSADTEEYAATTNYSRPSSRDIQSRGTINGMNTLSGVYEDDDYDDEYSMHPIEDPFNTWQNREKVAWEYGYQSIGMARNSNGQRPPSAASTSPRPGSGHSRPLSPEPLAPHPKAGKIRPKSEFGNAQNGAMGRSSEDKSEPWDVHLAATIPRPRNAITVVAPPTAPVRRPTTALQRGTPQPNTRPWSTDPELLQRAKFSKGPTLIHLSDGRPHTVGPSRDAVPQSKTVTYFEAFQLTGSHVEARRMMDTQHRMIGEARIRDYEHWEADKTDLVLQKKSTKRWGTSGEFPMENPVTRSAARQREEDEEKELDRMTQSALASGKLDDLERVNARIATVEQKRALNPHRSKSAKKRRPISAADVAQGNININEWGPGPERENENIGTGTGTGESDSGEGNGMYPGPLKHKGLSGAALKHKKIAVAKATKVVVDHNAKCFHKSMMTSYGTGEIEVLWQNLTAIPRSIMMSSLALQCQHLTALRISGNKITEIPKWLFPNLHGLVELNISNNKLTSIPSNIEILQKLEKLTCSYNKIQELPVSVAHLERLWMLDCTGNLIRRLPPRIGKLESLRLLRMGDNVLQFLSGGIENCVALDELILTRNKLGTLATITPLVVRQANQDHIWEKQRLPWGEVIYYNQTTTETLRRAPEGAVVVKASDYKSEDEVSEPSTTLSLQLTDEELRWKRKVERRQERLKLRKELAEEGKGVWEVKWTQFTGSAFYFNHFTKKKYDVMPKEIDKLGRLASVRRLVISFNVLQELPPSIGNLGTLEELVLDHNKLKCLPIEIGGMQRLKIISLTDNRLETFPKTIGKLQRLQRINGTYNHINSLPVEIAQLTGLGQLWLSNNKMETLPVEMWAMTGLQELFLSDNPLKGSLPSEMDKGIPFLLRELKEKWLRQPNNQGLPPTVSTVVVGVRGEIVLPEPKYKKMLEAILRHAKGSKSLEMQWKELHHIPIGAWDLIDLRELRLQNNFLQATAITEQLIQFTSLTILSLSNNQLHEFPKVLLKVRSILHLDLSNNYMPTLPEKIDKMYKLKTVNFSQNRLTSIPKRFGKLIDLTDINLDINHIGPTLPKEICGLYKLKTLKLVKNRLKSLPVSGMLNLTALTLLNVNSNSIGPTLPDDISYMPNLVDLRLSHNRLKILPTDFCTNDLSKVLNNLWLYGNRIIQLPHEFRFMTSLTDLRIENNPMISPPPELSLQGPERIRIYCRDRLARITDLKQTLRDEHIRFNPENLIPESKLVFTEGTDYLTKEDLADFDNTINRTLNGAYYNHTMNIHALTEFMSAKKLERRIAHHKLLLERFLIFLDIAIEKNSL